MAQSQFPKMGEHEIEGSLTNMSGRPSPYTTPRPKGGPSGDGESEPSNHRGVGSTATGERNGPTFRPVTTLYKQNAAEASATQRAMRTVPSSLGNRDFWNDRAASQSGQVI